MSKHEVYVPDSALTGFRKMTASQWLTEFRMRGDGRSRVFDLPEPVYLYSVERDEITLTPRIAATSTEFFRHLREIAEDRGMLVVVETASWVLGAHGLYALNVALRSYPTRRGGRNVVRHWLEVVTGARTPLRADVQRLFSYLEIRPVSGLKPAPASLISKYYVYSRSNHKVEPAAGGKTPARRAVRKKTRK